MAAKLKLVSSNWSHPRLEAIDFATTDYLQLARRMLRYLLSVSSKHGVRFSNLFALSPSRSNFPEPGKLEPKNLSLNSTAACRNSDIFSLQEEDYGNNSE